MSFMPSGSSVIFTPNIITHAEKNQKRSFLHGEEKPPRKTMCISLQTKKLYHNP